MIMMAVTVMAAVTLVVILVVALSLAMTVNLIGHLTDLNAVIQPGMNTALTVLI